MPQSPIHITGVSGTATSVYVGGFDRNVQVISYVTGPSAQPEGVLWVTGSERPGQPGVTLYNLTGGIPCPMDDVFSEIERPGFLNYINVYTTGVSSSYPGIINVVIRFDGPQWPSS